MSVLLKISLAIALAWSTFSFAQSNYAVNPATLALVDELVREEGFDRAYVEAVIDRLKTQGELYEPTPGSVRLT